MVTRRAFLAGISSAIVASLLTPWAVLDYARRILGGQAAASPNGLASGGQVDLPLPSLDGTVSLERALASRRSIREYTDEPITLEELSQILWAAYGVSEVRYGFRTTPSAGATYPLNIYAVAYPRGVMVGDGSYLAEGSYIYLQATALGLATVAIGAFYDEEVREIIGAGRGEHALYVMPIGRPAKPYRVGPEDLKAYISRHRRL